MRNGSNSTGEQKRGDRSKSTVQYGLASLEQRAKNGGITIINKILVKKTKSSSVKSQTPCVPRSNDRGSHRLSLRLPRAPPQAASRRQGLRSRGYPSG